MEALGKYLVSIVAVCMLSVVANGLVRAGTLQKIVRFVGGLLVLLAVAGPLLSLDMEAAEDYFSDLSVAQGFDAGEVSKTAEELYAAQIKRTTEQYIENYAQQLGAFVQAEVTLTEETYPKPQGALIRGGLDGTQLIKLTEYLTGSLGMEAGKVEWKIYE